VLFFNLNSFPQNNVNQYRGSSLSNQQLINSGISRLGDIYSLMNEWDSFTFDGYRWYTSVNGLSTLQNQNWILMLDGQQMDINFFNLKNINILPLTVNLVDSIETIEYPQIVSGEFITEGLINLRSLKPKHGLSVSGRYSAGNETGDPGPYFYTEHRSSNVEEDGPNLSAAISYGSNDLWGRFLFSTESYSATDTAIRKRNPQLGWQDFKGRRFSPSLQLGFNVLSGTHNLFLGYSTSKIQPFHPRTYTSNDLIYLNPAIKDFPVQMIFKHAGLNGNFNLSSSSLLNYSIKASSNKIYNTTIVINDFEHLQTNYYANLEYVKRGEVDYLLGIGFDHTELNANYSSAEKGISLFKIYSSLDFSVAENFIQKGGVEILFAKNTKAIRGYLNSYWKYSQNFWLELNISAIQTLPEEKKDLWYWVENGYDILKRLNIDYSFAGERLKESKFTADLNIGCKISSSIDLGAGFIYRNFGNYFIEEVTGIYNPDSSTFKSFVNANTNSSGSVAGFSLSINQKIFSSLIHEIEFRFLASVAGDSTFKNEWETIPQHKISYTISFNPYDSFSLWAKITYLSSVKWSYFPQLEEFSNNFYMSSLNQRVIVDFSVRKWFWYNQLRASLLFRNVLNNEIRHHPLGANFNLSIFLQIELALNSIF
jgi:hypothetical protein